MKTPDCDTCGNGAECRMGRDCPRRSETHPYVMRALVLYLALFWASILGAALTLWS